MENIRIIMVMEFFGKNTLKSYRVLQEFFGDESRSIAENIRDIGKLIKYAKSILDDAKMDNIIELKNRIINIKWYHVYTVIAICRAGSNKGRHGACFINALF